MEIFIKVNIWTTKNVDKDIIDGVTVLIIKVHFKMITGTVMGKCIGKMVKFIKDNGLTEYKHKKDFNSENKKEKGHH